MPFLVAMGVVYEHDFSSKAADARCLALARAQHGVLTRDQIFDCGLTKGQLRSRRERGFLERFLPNTYRYAGMAESWLQHLTAAILWAGEGSAISHRAAAALWTFEGCASDIVEMTVTKRTKAPRPELVIHHTPRLLIADLTTIRNLPVTTPSCTLLDLAAVADDATVERALDDALRRRLTSLPRMRWTIGRLGGKGRRGSRLMGRLLNERPDGYVPPASELERYVFTALVAGGLPEPVRQFEVREGGRFLARVDLAWPEVKVAVECESYRYHHGRLQFERDLHRRNDLSICGWAVFHATNEDVKTGLEELIDQVRSVLARRGGLPHWRPPALTIRRAHSGPRSGLHR